MNSFTVPTFIAPRFFSPFSIFFGKRKNYAAAEISQNRESIVSFFLLIFTDEEEELFDFLSTVVRHSPEANCINLE